MEFFLLKFGATVPFQLKITNTDVYKYRLTKENFDNMPEKATVYYHINENEETSDLLVRPTFMVSDILKHIISLYEPDIEWKSLYLLPDDEEEFVEKSVHYSIPGLFRQKCLHKDCVIQPNGAIDKLILDKKRLRNISIFQVEESQENLVLVSLELAESISRRHPYGVKLEKVEVK